MGEERLLKLPGKRGGEKGCSRTGRKVGFTSRRDLEEEEEPLEGNAFPIASKKEGLFQGSLASRRPRGKNRGCN